MVGWQIPEQEPVCGIWTRCMSRPGVLSWYLWLCRHNCSLWPLSCYILLHLWQHTGNFFPCVWVQILKRKNLIIGGSYLCTRPLWDCWPASDWCSQIMWSWVMWLELTKLVVARVSQNTNHGPESRGPGARQICCEEGLGRASNDLVSRAHASLIFLWMGFRYKRPVWRLRGLGGSQLYSKLPASPGFSLQSLEEVTSKSQRIDLLEISVFRNQKWAGALVEAEPNISKHCQGEQAAELPGSDGCERAGKASSQLWMCDVHLEANRAEPTMLHIRGHGTVLIPFAGPLFKRQSWPPQL